MKLSTDKALIIAAAVLLATTGYVIFTIVGGGRVQTDHPDRPDWSGTGPDTNPPDTNRTGTNRSDTPGTNSSGNVLLEFPPGVGDGPAGQRFAHHTWPDYPDPAPRPYQHAGRPAGNHVLAGRVVDAWGRPVAGAVVSVTLPGGNAAMRTERESGDAGTVTDTDGRYRFVNLPAGRLRVGAAVPHYLPWSDVLDEPRDDLTIQLSRHGVVGGRVVDGAGRAVKRFTVIVSWAGQLARPGEPRRPATPNHPAQVWVEGEPRFPSPWHTEPPLIRYTFDTPDGLFAMYTGIGRFVVTAFAGDSARPHVEVATAANSEVPVEFTLSRPTAIAGRVVDATRPDQPVPNARVIAHYANRTHGGSTNTDDDGRFRLDLARGGTIALQVQHPSYSPLERSVRVRDGEIADIVCELPPGMVVAGQVMGDSGEPVVGIPVRAFPRERHSGMRSGGSITKAQGRFRVTGLEPGRYVIEVGPQDGWVEHQQVVDLTPPDGATGLAIRLTRGARAVFRLSMSGGELPPNVRVMIARDATQPEATQVDPLDPTYSWAPESRFYHANADPETGVAEVTGMVPGHYTLTIRNRAFRTHQQPLTIEPGEQQFDIVLDAGVRFEPLVTDLEGRPLPGVAVTCRPNGASEGAEIRSSESGTDGYVRISGLEAARYRVTALLRDHRPWEREVDFASGDVPADITIDPGLSLTGTVFGPDGRPVRTGSVSLHAPPRGEYEPRPRTAIRNGDFEFGGLEAGRYMLEVRVPGMLPPEGELAADVAGSGEHIEIRMRTGARLTGTVRDSRDNPVGAACLRLIDPTVPGAGAIGSRAGVVGTVYTRSDGVFEMTGIEQGTYLLRVSAQQLAPHEEQVDVRGQASIAIVLGDGVVLSGTLRDTDGNPLQAAVVAVPADSDDGVRGEAQTDVGSGRFEITGLVPGRYIVQAIDPRTRAPMLEQRVLLQSSRDLELVATPPPTVKVSGIVRDTVGQPARAVRLSMRTVDGSVSLPDKLTDVGGYFLFPAVAPGRYVITAVTSRGTVIDPVFVIDVGTDDIGDLGLAMQDVIDGVRISRVAAGGPADQGGLRTYDVIVLYNGRTTRTRAELGAAVMAAAEAPGGAVEVKFVRDGERRSVYIPRGDMQIVPE